MDQSNPDVMNVNEVALYLRIPISSVYKLAQESKIPARKVGRHWRFHRDTLDAWLTSAPEANDTTIQDSEGAIKK